MAQLSLRDLPDNVLSALEMRANHNHRSLEDEILAILTSAVRSSSEVGLGQQLRAGWSGCFGHDFENLRDAFAERALHQR